MWCAEVVTPEHIALTDADLREVAAFALASAEEVLHLAEERLPGDPRPREAVEAARAFVAGEPRSRRQRVAALDAHRAAGAAESGAGHHAAMAAGDASASAYLHPLAQATQVGHILRATAHAARALELVADDPEAADRHLREAVARATSVLLDVLRRYPTAPTGRTRVALLMSDLDRRLRDRP